MSGISRKNLDIAGGLLIDPPKQDSVRGYDFCFSEGYPIAIVGQAITNHGEPPHDSAIMVEQSNVVFIDNQGVIRAGDLASCLHTASGSSIVFAD